MTHIVRIAPGDDLRVIWEGRALDGGNVLEAIRPPGDAVRTTRLPIDTIPGVAVRRDHREIEG